jgi:hypothetical protein
MTKLQTPNPNQTPRDQRMRLFVIGVWDLGFDWDLGFGIWSFAIGRLGLGV